MKRTFLLMMAMVAAGVSMAGNVKVLATEFATMDIDAEGAYFTIDVKLQASNVRQGEVACVALMNNKPWGGDNMTIEKLGELVDEMCEGEADLEAISTNKAVSVSIDVPLNAKLLTGQEKFFYLKTFVVDLKKNVILSEGQMIKFTPDTKAIMAQKKKQDKAMGFGILKSINDKQMSGDTHIGDVHKTCSYCGGSGRSGNGTCTYCGGSGKTTTKGVVKGKGTIFDLVP